ncbi:hypothetical protein MP228_000305 [Amoeboaphelidium protococcarum]|nr:hypothetical protein MP228_000305 [Amoeboaphelidium protococcarum]
MDSTESNQTTKQLNNAALTDLLKENSKLTDVLYGDESSLDFSVDVDAIILRALQSADAIQNQTFDIEYDENGDNAGQRSITQLQEGGQVGVQSEDGGVLTQDFELPTKESIIKFQRRDVPRPEWHAPWKLARVIGGHVGWVRCVAVDHTNEWFATGSADRMIKIWDLASGTLKLSLTGHISTVRAMAISKRSPYLFSAGEDNQVKCWDLEVNKVIRHYHGHSSGVYSLSLHPTLDLCFTGGRDSVVRCWDIRTRDCVHILRGHSHTITSLLCQEVDPQVISGSMDSTIRMYDLAAGKTMTTLTHHKKGVRALASNPVEFSFCSASQDGIKQWRGYDGKLLQNLQGHNALLNTVSINEDNVLFSGGDDGSMQFWDYKSGYSFQQTRTKLGIDNVESDAGIFCSSFDITGSRLITGEADKLIKIWKEDPNATPQTHPILNWTPSLMRDNY